MSQGICYCPLPLVERPLATHIIPCARAQGRPPGRWRHPKRFPKSLRSARPEQPPGFGPRSHSIVLQICSTVLRLNGPTTKREDCKKKRREPKGLVREDNCAVQLHSVALDPSTSPLQGMIRLLRFPVLGPTAQRWRLSFVGSVSGDLLQPAGVISTAGVTARLGQRNELRGCRLSARM